MGEKKEKKEKEKETKCPLCRVSEETIKRLKEKGKTKKELADKNGNK